MAFDGSPTITPQDIASGAVISSLKLGTGKDQGYLADAGRVFVLFSSIYFSFSVDHANGFRVALDVI